MASKKQEVKQALRELKEEFEKNGEFFEDSDAQELKIRPPTKPDFPTVIFIAAVFKDILDGLDLTGYLVILTTILTLFFGVILFSWVLSKGGGYWQRRIIRWALTRFGIVIVIEAIPFLKIIPTMAIFVILVHNREKKIIGLFLSALEKLQKAGF